MIPRANSANAQSPAIGRSAAAACCEVWIGWLALIGYVALAGARLDFSVERFVIGLDNAERFLGRMFPPEILQADSMARGLAESLEIAVLASTAGIALSLPLGILAARNLMPAWVSWPARSAVALCRSFHPVIVAIVFVKAIGFGALSGIAALTVASVGFIGKLFAEAIENVPPGPGAALRAQGVGSGRVFLYATLPQVLPLQVRVTLQVMLQVLLEGLPEVVREAVVQQLWLVCYLL